MSGKTNSTVNNLRAMFEQNQDSTSPPSRGRSPVGSENLTAVDSRPLSKVRTSFVSVERIGQKAPFSNMKKQSDNNDRSCDPEGGSDSKVTADSAAPKVPELNGNKMHQSPGKASVKSDTLSTGKPADGQEHVDMPSIGDSKVSLVSGIDNAQDTEAEDTLKTSPAPAPDAQSEESNIEASKPDEEPQDLGAILKGAPFEQEGEIKPDASQKADASTRNGPASTSKETTTSKSEPSNSHIKIGPTAKAASQQKFTSSSSRPPAINTKKSSPKAAKVAAASTDSSKASPKALRSPNAIGRLTSSKTASPRQQVPSKPSNNIGRENKKEPISKISRAPAGAKAPGTTTAKAEKSVPNGNPVKKPSLSSPTAKPRPKSPTRPVRLPAAATATTASSAAKLGDTAPSRSPSRASTTNTSKPSLPAKDRGVPSSREPPLGVKSTVRKSSSRPSLPAPSTTTQKSKARLSIASTKAPEGSFLARMMRPTQSSASKTHEKVEHAPPGKSHPIRSKRKSGGSEEDEKGAGADEPLPTASRQQDEQGPAPNAEATDDALHETAATEEAVHDSEANPMEMTPA